ncbi:hypothetical protein [Bordetella avium]|uniref:Membrane protein n=1 Tax=Bordetella avium (strain 197N) TaxID=360910 RepID=Q2L037_BORA1|nr:hypothetical protein [Bordetella avium]CAJ47880.1 putative membrane protein [Bordetella avium 197N]
MSAIVFTLTRRMLTLLAICIIAVFLLLFLLGVQIGSRVAAPPAVKAEVKS